MFDVRDLFQWERFITPSIIKPLFWLVVVAILIFGFHGIAQAFGTMTLNLVPGILQIVVNLLGMAAGIIAARVAAEFVLLAYRINEHLSAIRSQGDM